MERFTFRSLTKNNPRQVVISMQIYNILIGILNITGNAILIWALRRTGQIKTISFQFIAIMSASDLTNGIAGTIFLTLTTMEKYQGSQFIKLVSQFILLTCNAFSILMIVLIAFDRYLHMKLLENYSTVFTKKRGYLAVIVSCIIAISTSIAVLLLVYYRIYLAMQLMYFTLIAVALVSILILYNNALSALRRKAHLITRTIINLNKELGNAAKRISICIFMLTTPIAIFLMIDNINLEQNFMDESVLNICLWYSYITFLANGFCSSIIFISQNTPIRRFLKRLTRYYWNRMRSNVGAIGNDT